MATPQRLLDQHSKNGIDDSPGLVDHQESTQDGELSQTEDEADDAPNDEMFGLFLAGIKNPKDEFPEDGSEVIY